MSKYELWDIETGNRIGGYRSLKALRADVRADIARYGKDSPEIRNLVVMVLETDGSRVPIDGGNVTLVAWALSEQFSENISKMTPRRDFR